MKGFCSRVRLSAKCGAAAEGLSMLLICSSDSDSRSLGLIWDTIETISATPDVSGLSLEAGSIEGLLSSDFSSSDALCLALAASTVPFSVESVVILPSSFSTPVSASATELSFSTSVSASASAFSLASSLFCSSPPSLPVSLASFSSFSPSFPVSSPPAAPASTFSCFWPSSLSTSCTVFFFSLASTTPWSFW